MAGPFALINPFLISLCKRLTNLVSIKNPYFSFNNTLSSNDISLI